MVTAVVGALFGSEGKGLIVGHIAKDYLVHVRVGAANAGHTVWVNGEKHVLQQLPCAAYANPYAKLVLGAGAMISPEILADEIRKNKEWRHRKALLPMQLYIDHRAHSVTEWHKMKEAATDLAERIGSTSAVAREGIGAAQAARAERTNYMLAKDDYHLPLYDCITWCDTVKMLHDALVFRTPILLEGTQGTGLSNTTGFYPYVTSRNVTAAGIAADCGLGPQHINRVILVARTFPIRVAGNSGPFYPDSKEISWADLGVDEEKERTTVTKKVRRVATFSYDQIEEAVRLNSATHIALTFADYICPEIAGVGGHPSRGYFDMMDNIGPMIRRIEDRTGVEVRYVGTGPETVMDR